MVHLSLVHAHMTAQRPGLRQLSIGAARLEHGSGPPDMTSALGPSHLLRHVAGAKAGEYLLVCDS